MSVQIPSLLVKELLSTRLQFTGAFLTIVSGAALALTFAGLLSSDDSVEEDLSEIQEAQERVSSLSEEISDLRRELVVTRTYTDEGLRDEIAEVKSRQDAIEDALSQDIERAFLVASLREDLTDIESVIDRQERSIDNQISRIYTLLAIVTGLFVSLFIGGMGWLITTLNRLVSLSDKDG